MTIRLTQRLSGKAFRNVSNLSVTNDRVEVDVLIALIDISLEETWQEFDLSSFLVMLSFTAFALLLSPITQSGRLENDLVCRLFHLFFF